MMQLIAVALVGSIVLAAAAPSGDFAASGQISGTAPKLISFDNGNVGVNFLGFKASAGLGGLLSGDASAGGLHAEAGTPFGQAAKAGLGGNIDGKGASVGGLYADATAGGDIGAGAGLAGTSAGGGSHGFSYAGASAGGIQKTSIKTTQVRPVVEFETQKEVVAPVVFQKHVQFSSAPVVHKEVEVVKEVAPQKTYVERTVIPRYQEKTIYVPSYVEKTIRVPTVVEKKISVPAPPKVVEKIIDVPPPNVHIEKSFLGGGVGGGGVYGGGAGGGYGGNYYGEGYKTGNIGGGGTVSVRKSVNPDFINNIFNIPISTLGAVSKLVGGIVGGTSGSFSVSKTAGVSAY